MEFYQIDKFLWVGIGFIVFYITCLILMEGRFCKKKTLLMSGILAAGIVLLQAGLLISSQDQMLVLTIAPLTAFLPAIVGVHILSGSGFIQTMAVWGMGLLVSGILFFLRTNLLWTFNISAGAEYNLNFWIFMVCLLLAAVLLLFVVVRCFSRYHDCPGFFLFQK